VHISYEKPTISPLGSVVQLTQINKCGGSGDATLPQLDDFTNDACPPGP
jgi:hypothetical protein